MKHGKSSSKQADTAARQLAKFERTLGCRFKNRSLLEEALTHSSYVYEHPEEGVRDYERLEFIGDAVLELAISDILFKMRPSAEEGVLTLARADLVNRGRLAQIARELGIGEVLRLGEGERKVGGAAKPSILACALEAVLGALYLDRGWRRAYKLIERLFGDVAASQPEDLRDPRGILQEWAQARHKTIPRYRYLSTVGPPHKRVFRVEIIVDGEVLSTGKGGSKKDACRNAAQAALEKIMPKHYNKSSSRGRTTEIGAE